MSISEEVAEVYYQKKGYFTIRNKPFLSKLRSKKQPGNLDIDVLAINDSEIVIVSCKRGQLNRRQEIMEIKRFEKAVKFLETDEKMKKNY